MEFIGKDFLDEKGISHYKIPFVSDGINIGYPLSIADLVKFDLLRIIPNKLGLYQLFLNGRMVYVGMSSVSIRSRIKDHVKDKNKTFDALLWYISDKITEGNICKIEANMINKHNPELNRSGDGIF